MTGGTDVLWGKTVHVTSALGAGTALIGTRAAGQVMSRGPATLGGHELACRAVLATSDQVAIRCERRLALTVFRPGALCEVRLA